MIDYNTPEAQAALQIAMTRKVKNLGQGHVVDFILLSKGSLWYIQAKRWAETPPPNIKGEAAEIWKEASQLIVKTVDLGYNSETNRWWDQVGKTKEQVFREILVLSDFGMMLEQYRLHTNEIISRGFETFIEIINGYRWKTNYRKFLKKIEEQNAKTNPSV